jgi:nucleoside-diphosphate-sugar epimerase
MHKRIVLVTGASGFIGRALLRALEADGQHVRIAVRRPLPASDAQRDTTLIGDISGDTDWRAAVAGVDTIVHLAGLAHVEKGSVQAASGGHHRVNAEGTEALAKAAVAAGVRRFILASSIGVNGTNSGAHPFKPNDPPNPSNAYGESKRDAEVRLRTVAEHSSMSWVVVRPPMVYGAEAPGNFARLARIARTGIPLPVGASTARRAFVAVDNLTDLIQRLVTSPAAANQTFLVRDALQPTVGELIGMIGQAIGKPSRVVSVSPVLVKGALSAIGRGDDYERLFAPLEIDMSDTTERLGWTPPISLQEGLRRALTASPAAKT